MKIKNLLSVVMFFLCVALGAQNFPGGVIGAEVWYAVNWQDSEVEIWPNKAIGNIELKKCSAVDKSLFNFNASFSVETLCVSYMASLENTTGRNVFFVGEPKKPKYSLSYLGSLWRDDLGTSVNTDNIIRNFFDFNSRNIYAQEVQANYTGYADASINFYHSNHYNIDQKFKSYGYEGETLFYIGKPTLIDPQVNYEDLSFGGNFPEFISYPRELSENERNRVESYLALKYGLTLSKDTPYLNSKNLIFWNTQNNDLFSKRIFGFGKDMTSNLNQLQSQSTHLKKHLVAAIEKIVETNMEKQELVSIPNNHFLVFGDNDGKTALVKGNSHNIKYWEKVWLAQRTGKDMGKHPIDFKLYLNEDFVDFLIENPELTVWFMHDKYVGYDEVSDFEGGHIEYHNGEIDLENKTAYFKKIYFDSDQNIYDQYTFGVGPEMIVQAYVKGCKEDRLRIVLNITGGRPGYNIVVESDEGGFEDETENNSYTFSAIAGVTYNITVTDSEGLTTQLEILADPWGFNLNLGPDQYLSDDEPEILLDAGEEITDPEASYQWYLDGVLLDESSSVLTVSEPGTYKVVVTSEDLSCAVKDEINIYRKSFSAAFDVIEGCDEQHNVLTITIVDGSPNFTTSLVNQGNEVINYAHSGSTTISNISYGTYMVTVTDAVGDTVSSFVTFAAPPTNLGVDIYAQMEAFCDTVTYDCNLNYNHPYFDDPYFVNGNGNPFSLDASLGVNNSLGLNYEWFVNGESLGLYTPNIEFQPAEGSNDYCFLLGETEAPSEPIFTVVATSPLSNCSVSQSFVVRYVCPVLPGNPSISAEADNSEGAQGSKLEFTTSVYPNPVKSGSDFVYNVASSQEFDGVVEVYTINGVQLYQRDVQGDSNYDLTFNLNSSGVYLIRVTSSLGIVKTNRIIIN